MQDYTHSYHLLQHNTSEFMLTYTEHKTVCNAAPLHTGAPQASESFWPDTKESLNRHDKAWFGISDMQDYSTGVYNMYVTMDKEHKNKRFELSVIYGCMNASCMFSHPQSWRWHWMIMHVFMIRDYSS